MSLHPYFQIRAGDSPITTVPPSYVQRFVHKSGLEQSTRIDFTVIDPTYREVEEQLILSDTGQQPIFSRFGYLDDAGNVSGHWVQSRLLNFVPRLTTQGMEITASTIIDIGDAHVRIETRVYSGKISDVVKQIAADLELEAEVEETDDDYNLSTVDENGGPKLWRVRNMTLPQFIKEKLRDEARSKTGKSNYEFFITGQRAIKKPILHFHTKEFPCFVRDKPAKEFTYLVGKQDEVLEFEPNYQSTILGNVGAGQLVMRAYDPITKQYTTKTQSILTNPDTVSIGDGAKTNAVPTTPDDPNSDLASQGVIMARRDSIEASNAFARNRWEALKAASLTASLELVGLPYTADIEANDLLKVNVLVPNQPDASGPAYRVHWSSGVYHCVEAVHEIGQRYTVQCQLQRSAVDLGNEPAPPARLTA